MKKTVIVSLVVAGCIAVGSFLFSQQRGESQSPANVYRFSNGLTVTPLSRQSNEVAELLDIKLWKFIVEIPNPNVDFVCDLELREKGKPTKVVGSYQTSKFVSNKQTRDELSVGIYPVNGDFGRSKEIKWRIGFAGQWSSMTIPNPFKNAGSYGETPTTSLKSADVFLLQARLENPPELRNKFGMGIRDVELFMKVKTTPHKS